LAPENTLRAFVAAVALGLDFVECDVRATKDGEVAVFHDEFLRRLTGLPGKLGDRTRSWLSTGARVLSREPVLFLDQLVEFLRGHPATGLFVEIKEPGLEERVVNILDGLSPGQASVAGGFDSAVVRKLTRPSSRFQRVLVVEKIPPDPAAWAGAEVLAADCRHLTRQQAEMVGRAGLSLWSWTANSPAAIRRLLEWGVDGIITDDPALALTLAGERK